MSPDFERRLRDARATLPEPEPGPTERARAGALRSLRHRRPRARLAALVGVAVVVALAVGAALGTLIAPDVTASRGPVGLGFVPQPGWYVLQTSARERPDDPVVTIAANVPFAREDDVGGLAEASGLPYETLLGLPPNGVVIVATFLPGGVSYTHLDPTYPYTTLPLQLSRAVPRVLYGTQVRPEAPLGQYQLRATIEGYSVDVIVYFGRERPTSAQFSEAQRQLSSLVVRTPRAEQPVRKAVPKRSAATTFDRTFSCATLINGGIHEIEARSHAGIRESGSRWKTLPFAAAATGNTTSVDTRLDNSLAWITAGALAALSHEIEDAAFAFVIAGVPVLDSRIIHRAVVQRYDFYHRRVELVLVAHRRRTALEVVHRGAFFGDQQSALELARLALVDAEIGGQIEWAAHTLRNVRE